MPQRPKGVTVLSLLALVGGILSFVAGVALLFGGSLGAAFGAPQGGSVMTLGAVMFGLGSAGLLLGYGFWMLKRWAWSAAFVVYGVSIAVNVASLLMGATLVSVAVPLVVAAAVMLYLVRPETRAVLGR